VEVAYLVFWGSVVKCCALKHRVKSDELEDRLIQGMWLWRDTRFLAWPPAPPGCKHSSVREGAAS